LAEHRADGRVSIFPVVARERALALLYAWGTVQGSALELLSQMAAAVWGEMVTPAATQAPVAPLELVRIAPVPAPRKARPWEDLPPDEQQIHLRAQRFARVQAADLRLREPDAVQSGRAQKNLYETLKGQIDAARSAYRKTYFAT